MAEPWLDSLSEDWDSEPRLSSPAPSVSNSRYGTQNSALSQSRIPHLAHSMRRESSSGSFLKPRSSRGIAKAKGLPILSERSASSLNLPGSNLQDSSLKRNASSTVPRTGSSNFSSSQQSVQHHTVDNSIVETPEWKKRIQNGEDIASDGFDLFAPSKLEGIFSQHAHQSSPDQENQPAPTTTEQKPWVSLKYSNLQPSSDRFQSFRTSRSRVPPMAALPELDEDEDDKHMEHSLSAISSELARSGSMRGLVQRRVTNLEQAREKVDLRQDNNDENSPPSRDPRWRTLSGQQELRDEYISPVTASTKNTISARAVRESIELNPDVLKKKLMDVSSDDQRRPSSRSSDKDVSYNGQGKDESLLHEDLLQDMTSHSLPEDLSMGTQDFVSHGGYVNLRRGPASNEASFLKKKLSPIRDFSHRVEKGSSSAKFRSSPPPYDTTYQTLAEESKNDVELPSSFHDGSVVRHETTQQRPTSAGSPLKLFGNRDTYTNNKLLRVLSQYERDGSDLSRSSEDLQDIPEQNIEHEVSFRMSQFGKGELDTYNFEKEVTRPSVMPGPTQLDGDKIFQSFADLTIDDEGTIPGVKFSAKDVCDDDFEDAYTKRVPSSPTKDRTPKRRRTLVREDVVMEEVPNVFIPGDASEKSALAGTKRKDARPGEGGVQADPEVLATRSILQPKSGSRKSSSNSQARSVSQDSTIRRANAPGELAEALAIELASFAQGISKAQLDSRKPSLATKDYMEEANKVMEFIRARGKPKTHLAEIQEPSDFTELDADKILDLEVEDDSTVEPFSRPPSREGPVKPRVDRRVAKHDSHTANHLRRFKDSDDLELLASTSVIGTLHLADHNHPVQTPILPTLVDEQESSPANIRILNPEDTHGKRKHSTSTRNDQINTIASSDNSTRQTFTTESSNSSGKKGVISSGKVSIPDNVGTMTFDHEKQIWVKQHLAKLQRKQSQTQRSVRDKHEEATLEDDPFEDIPDLSIDEDREAAMKKAPISSSSSWRPSTTDTVRVAPSLQVNDNQQKTSHEPADAEEFWAFDEAERKVQVESVERGSVSSSRAPMSIHSEASKHEERLHQGVPSKVLSVPGTPNKQARVVTIAFSSPVASEILRPIVTAPEPVSDDEDFLPPDDSEDDTDYLKTPRILPAETRNTPEPRQRLMSLSVKRPQFRSNGLNGRPISRIEERDEESQEDEGKSLIHIKEAEIATPGPANQLASAKATSGYKGTSILCLTPLSEFTMHQADRANHPEESFVGARAHPKALLQAHGALALSVDTLVKAITDAIPNEPFWEQLRRLDLKDSRLKSVHGLQDYCSGLETLDISHNQIAQLDGMPSSLRHLDISHNMVNDFTSWCHLQNLQYVDVSNNQLENLEAFASLIHIRKLKCSGNSISDIEGVVDSDGLMSLDLRGNRLREIDFEGVDMPRLEELDLGNNQLTSVRNLHCLPRLRKLDLSGNSIHDMQVREPLNCLKELLISRNELTNLDLSVFPALTRLNVDDNCIKDLAGLPTAMHLRMLSIRNQRDSNGIFDLVLATPNECVDICLSSNTVPDGQIRLPKYPHYNLCHLEMAACGVESLPVGFGDYFPNCRSLNLNFNAVSELSPLLGMVKLQTLTVAVNRIKRLRRTCLTLSRMPMLEKVDIRNNPLTVGFYPQDQVDLKNDETYLLPRRSVSQDLRWLQLLDETTALKRKMIELLFLEGCQKLKEVDGLSFDREKVRERGAVWNNLTSKGVLVRMIEAPPVQMKSPSAVEMPVDDTEKEGGVYLNADEGDMNMHTLTRERSLTVE